ncbi:MAG: GlsB/YeaQ/YmgE family stress response membrane protein [Hyphomicrobiaceae bacterium]|nr:GlsB/YeaQ/YmgE family stress response membrane protein [Hyphomicrobiaceae bacterium]
MPITLAHIVVWLIIGLIGGTLAGMLVKRERAGFGFWTNLGVGLVGALVGGLLFRLFDLLPALNQVAISLRDVVSAFVGSLLFLLGWWIWHQIGSR